jgi:hypothetical protein
MSTGGPGHEHAFDPISGWCSWCNLRDDGRLVDKGGTVLREGPEYTIQQLEQFRQKAKTRR